MPESTLTYVGDELAMDGVPLAAIARDVGTPVYVYSLQRIMAQLERLRAAFAPLRPAFYYSLKANANRTLIRALVAADCGCDTVSAGEIFLARRSGCPPERIVFAGVGKTRAEIRYALETGIAWLNVENIAELRRVNALAGELGCRPHVALRLNPAVQAVTHRHIATGHAGAKFGIALVEARTILERRADYRYVDIAGLHMHIGSQLGRPDESAAAARLAVELAREFRLRHLNLGGGFPVAYEGGFAVPVEDFAAALLPILTGQGLEVAFEPGRFLVAESGVLLAEVQYVKHGGRTVVLDAGMNDLLRPALYEARHPLLPLRAGKPMTQPVQVVGPICESADVIHPAASLPSLVEGDLVAIGVAGAYGMTMASNYNGRPRPAEVLVENGTWRVIRARETFEDFIRHEPKGQ